MVVDGSREGTFGAFLADDKGVEVGFEEGRGDAGWGVGIAERALVVLSMGDSRKRRMVGGIDLLPSALQPRISP